MKKRIQKKKNNYKMWFALPVILVIVLVGFALAKTGDREEDISLSKLHDEKGYIRKIENEEYEFFKKLVDRNLPDNITEEELDVLTREKINRSNAEFMLAAQMGLCSPYSFENFQKDMEKENSQRKLKKEKGEVFYGPLKFDLITYYNYISTNQKLDMVTFIMENADDQVMEGAKAYFEEFSEKYLTIKAIKYLLSENNEQQEKSIEREEFSTLEKTDSTLFEFLYYGEINDTMDYMYNDNQRTVQIISVEYEELGFENNIERVVRDYITNVYLEDWIQNIEENYPVEFNLS